MYARLRAIPETSAAARFSQLVMLSSWLLIPVDGIDQVYRMVVVYAVAGLYLVPEIRSR